MKLEHSIDIPGISGHPSAADIHCEIDDCTPAAAKVNLSTDLLEISHASSSQCCVAVMRLQWSTTRWFATSITSKEKSPFCKMLGLNLVDFLILHCTQQNEGSALIDMNLEYGWHGETLVWVCDRAYCGDNATDMLIKSLKTHRTCG